jgi:hypothetical protein
MKRALRLLCLPLTSLAVLAAGPDPAPPPSPLLRAVPPEQAGKLRKEYWKVAVHLTDGSEVKGVLSGYSASDEVLRVAPDPDLPYYTEQVPREKVKSFELLGEAKGKPVTVAGTPRERMLGEIVRAKDGGKLGELIAQHEAKLKAVKFGPGKGWLDVYREVTAEVGWLTVAYCEEQDRRDEKAVLSALDRIAKLPVADERARGVLRRRIEGMRRRVGRGKRPGGDRPHWRRDRR